MPPFYFFYYYNFIIITIYNKEKKTRIIIKDITLIVKELFIFIFLITFKSFNFGYFKRGK